MNVLYTKEHKLKKEESRLLEEFESAVHNIRLKFVKENAEFKVGDFIRNVTGIIKVDEIAYEVFMDTIEIVYKGLRYWPYNGELKRTKDKKISSLTYELTKVKL